VMPLATLASPARAPSRRFAATVPGGLEAIAIGLAMALLLPLFAQVADFSPGRDRRFTEAGFRIEGLPPPLLPALCRDPATAAAEGALRERLCPGIAPAVVRGEGARLSPAIGDALGRATQIFVAPLTRANERLEALRQRQREGDDVRSIADAVAAIEADLQPFVERFQLGGDAGGPRPLGCATRWAEATLAAPGEAPPARANGVLLLAAALDGRHEVESLAGAATLPALSGASGCGASAAPLLASTATLMADGRQSAVRARKNEAMRELLQTAGWQWAGALGLGWLLMLASRRRLDPALGVALSLAAWAAAAWVARVPWPFAGGRGFDPGRAEVAWDSRPATWVLMLAGGAVLALVVAALRRRDPVLDAAAPAQAMSSRVGYAGLVLATGIGWLLLFDLSAHAHRINRYLALYHQGHLWLGLLVFSLFLFLRRPLAHGLAWSLSIAGEAARAASQRLGSVGATLAIGGLATLAVLGFGFAFANLRQLTSELGRVWLIVGAAWFFFLRAGPLAERLARAGPAGISFWRYV